MNKIFKKVFNARRGKYVAVDETKTGHGQMGTCTVGGQKPAALTAAVVGAVLATGLSSGVVLAAANAPVHNVEGTEWVVARQDHTIDQQDGSLTLDSLAVTGSGGKTNNIVSVDANVTTYTQALKAVYTTKQTKVYAYYNIKEGGMVYPTIYDQDGNATGQCTSMRGCTSYERKFDHYELGEAVDGETASKTYESEEKLNSAVNGKSVDLSSLNSTVKKLLDQGGV